MQKQRYLKLIDEHFPDIAFDKVRWVHRGWDNVVLVLDERLVFRFPKRDGYLERFKAEVVLLRYLHDIVPIAVPDYAFLPDDMSFGGYHIVPGRPLRRSICKRLNAPTKEIVSRELGEFLSVLHGIAEPQAKSLGLKPWPAVDWGGTPEMERLYADIRARVFPRLNKDEQAWLAMQFERCLELRRPPRSCVVHNDLTDDHIYLVPELGKLGGIIDFADAALTDPAMDFAGLWYYGRRFVEQVLGHYSCDIDDELLERSRIPSRVHAAEKMLWLLEGKFSFLPFTFDEARRQLNRDMILFKE